MVGGDGACCDPMRQAAGLTSSRYRTRKVRTAAPSWPGTCAPSPPPASFTFGDASDTCGAHASHWYMIKHYARACLSSGAIATAQRWATCAAHSDGVACASPA